MPEIKHDFSTGRMNKDLDERLVPNGEYRDALNIQVKTTDSDSSGIGDAGTVQNLQGNERIASSYLVEGYDGKKAKIIGSIADDATNSTYYFTAAPVPNNFWPEGVVGIPVSSITSEVIWVDSIIRVDIKTVEDVGAEPIIVDRFAVTNVKAGVLSCDTSGDINNGSVYKSNGSFESTPTNGYEQLQVLDGTKYRIGMRIYAQTSAGVNLLSDGDNEFVEIVQIQTNLLTLAKKQNTDLNTATVFKFVHPERVLEFDYHKEGVLGGINVISSINILDDLLMWTDGKHEPKKLNITRCHSGCDDDETKKYITHTQLHVEHPTQGDTEGLVPVSELENLGRYGLSADIKRENITTIKVAPTSPPSITIKDSDRLTVTSFPLTGFEFVIDANNDGTLDNPPKAGDWMDVTFPDGVDFRLDDIYIFTASNTVDPIAIRARITDIDEDNPNQVTIELLFVDSDLSKSQNPSNWTVDLEKKDPLFEAKFGRFAYRYQYEDNEYSTFSPWSELAFLPGDFLYTPEKGYNEGMANTVRQLIIRDFIPNNYVRPHDVKSIDILWKTTDNANIYIVKSIAREIDTEWRNFLDSEITNTGIFTITSEMIYKVVEANQLLRAWDNVPRYATAQEITGNRLVYGNYVQGYDIKSNIGLKQTIESNLVSFPKPKKSVKSLRTYQFGIVIGDKYGRETSVISNGYKAGDGQVLPGTAKVPKNLSSYSNRFKLQQSWEGSDPTSIKWIDYIKYYVKETSNEYYNLVLDRWYDAGDDNVWLSFNSADRDKVSEETYLILKNEHGGQGAVEEKAKYKIIAIENEAPDYVKTDRRKFELIEIDDSNIYGGNHPNTMSDASVAITDAVPSRLIDFDTIRTQNISEDYLKDLEFKGTPKLRIVAKFKDSGGIKYEARSPERTITNIIKESPRGFGIREEFTLSDVNMYQKILTQLDDATDLPIATADTNSEFRYFIQLADHVVENKPQFDGKFFAKVANDNVLQERILGNSLGEYEVLNTYEIAYIANEQTNPAQDSNEYASEMAYEDFAWPSNEELAFTNSNIAGTTTFQAMYGGAVSFDGHTTDDADAVIPNFANLWTPSFGGENQVSVTDDFWVAWYNSPSRTADIFIDAATAFSGFNLQTDSGTDALPDFNSDNPITGESGPINTVDGETNWQPQGLSNGAYSGEVWGADDNMGQLTFSMIGGPGKPRWDGTNSYFKAKMQTPGTLFRFRDDPNQEVYRVWQANQPVNGDNNDGIEAGPIDIESKNFDNNGTSDYVDRHSIIVRFQRLDNQGNSTGNGLDASVWDPRGTVQHNGLGSLTIDFVQRTQVQNLSDESISTSSACFETEPKEDLGLDIFYEATGGVPVRLKQKNIKTFTGSNTDRERASLFTVGNRRQAGALNEEVNLTGEPFVYETFGADTIQIQRKVGDVDGVDLTTIITDSIGDGVCAAIGDYVSFRNRNGLVTKSSIADHVKVNSSIKIPSPSDRFTVSSVNLSNRETLIDPFRATAGTPSVGDEVTGDGIDTGTFVTVVNSVSFPDQSAGFQVTISKPTISAQASASLTFIDVTGYFRIDDEVWKYPVELGWFNCYSFGNGVESDRIRDDFNTPQIDNGVKASSTFLGYGEEIKGSGMIYSGLYNSTSSVNNLNEFNQAEKITKDLNTIHGSIQAMKTRDNDVVVFTEDKVLKVQSSGKDAVFNADNNPQLTATDKVLGTAMPFSGDYGISKNPESLAFDNYRMYFTDMQRGAVLRLSGNGLTPISDVGMKNYFRENLKKCNNLIGSFDGVNDEYNLTLDVSPKYQLDSTTISFNENSKGWVSFKSFIPLTAVSVNDKYYSVNNNEVWEHYSDAAQRNSFYAVNSNNVPTLLRTHESEIEVLFNDSPGSVKSFTAVNYEGSQAKINQSTTSSVTDAAGNSITANDGEYYNLSSKSGWYVDDITTDLQSGGINEFIEKENKWFNYIKGTTTTLNNLDASEVTVQGIGFPLINPTDTQTEQQVIIQATDADGNPI